MVMVLGLPLWSGLFDIDWFESVCHRFGDEMQFAVHTVPLIVGMCPQVGARKWREALVTMSSTHRCLLHEAPMGPRRGSLSLTVTKHHVERKVCG